MCLKSCKKFSQVSLALCVASLSEIPVSINLDKGKEMYYLRKFLLLITATSLVGESLSLCGVDDSFVSPENDGRAYQIQHAQTHYVVHKYICELRGPGKISG